MKTMPEKLTLMYKKLYASFGPQHWWPGETPFEIAVGAILTQNTNWGNVEKAIVNLKDADVLKPAALNDMSHERLAALIRPAGYFNIKAKRLKNFIGLLINEYHGSMSGMKQEDFNSVRKSLLSVNGIGPETADSIILYALEKPVFVIDAYTKRVLSRHNILDHDASYEEFQSLFQSKLKEDISLFSEYHALFVRLAKENCRTKPVCTGCPLEGM
ncbi:MAG: HhH-GPD family protein [Nitrospirae bacterium]|nr:HhH-GPD family protein [Nitrospirota bacterium]MBS1234594.1 HhH-GPD family protein [Nitrospirota bacterium]